MKQVKAVIRPEKLSDVHKALSCCDCYAGIMISEITGQGNQKGLIQAWRGEKYEVDLIPKVVIDLVVKDSDLDTVIKLILENAYTGEIGDGKIFVYNVEKVVRIRTKDMDDAAI